MVYLLYIHIPVIHTCMSRGPQQAEILDTDAEIRAEILLEIRDLKSQAIFSSYFHKIRKFISRELHCATSGFVTQ